MTRARDVANLIGSGNYSSTTFTATAGQTAFTISHTQGFIQVFMNGLLLDETVDYTSNGSAVTLTSGAAAGDEIEVVKYNTFSVGDAIPASGGTFTGNVNVTGDTASLTLTDTSSHSANTGPGVSFFSKDSGGTSREVAKIVGESHSGSNEGNLAFQTRNGGTLETKWKVYKNGNWLPSNSAYGIYLGTTTAVDANLLDDYEEGAWTPSANNGSFTGIIQGRYTKVGNKVTAWAYIQSINNTTTNSNLEISGLPFSPASSGVLDSTVGPIMLRYLDVGVTEEIGVVVHLSGGGSVLRIYVLQTSGTYTPVKNAHFSNGGIGFRFSITYQV